MRPHQGASGTRAILATTFDSGAAGAGRGRVRTAALVRLALRIAGAMHRHRRARTAACGWRDESADMVRSTKRRGAAREHAARANLGSAQREVCLAHHAAGQGRDAASSGPIVVAESVAVLVAAVASGVGRAPRSIALVAARTTKHRADASRRRTGRRARLASGRHRARVAGDSFARPGAESLTGERATLSVRDRHETRAAACGSGSRAHGTAGLARAPAAARCAAAIRVARARSAVRAATLPRPVGDSGNPLDGVARGERVATWPGTGAAVARLPSGCAERAGSDGSTRRRALDGPSRRRAGTVCVGSTGTLAAPDAGEGRSSRRGEHGETQRAGLAAAIGRGIGGVPAAVAQAALAHPRHTGPFRGRGKKPARSRERG